jgi:hypothetical protein
MQIQLSAQRAFRVLTATAITLTLISLVARTANVMLEAGYHRPIKLVDIDEEVSVPTWFSSTNLFLTSLLLTGVFLLVRRQEGRRFQWHWLFLAIGFLVLSIDESIALHELSGAVVKKGIPARGVLRFTWIVWGMVLVVVLAGVYAKFILTLPPRRRRQFIVAGALFVFASIGMEMVGGKLMDHYNSRNALAYILQSHVEEFLEMFAIILFNTALIEHIGSLTNKDGLTLQFTGGGSVDA